MQVVLVSGGHTLYAGPRDSLASWLGEGGLGCGPYMPVRHGAPPDWALDVVNIGFRKPGVGATGCGSCGLL